MLPCLLAVVLQLRRHPPAGSIAAGLCGHGPALLQVWLLVEQVLGAIARHHPGTDSRCWGGRQVRGGQFWAWGGCGRGWRAAWGSSIAAAARRRCRRCRGVVCCVKQARVCEQREQAVLVCAAVAEAEQAAGAAPHVLLLRVVVSVSVLPCAPEVGRGGCSDRKRGLLLLLLLLVELVVELLVVVTEVHVGVLLLAVLRLVVLRLAALRVAVLRLVERLQQVAGSTATSRGRSGCVDWRTCHAIGAAGHAEAAVHGPECRLLLHSKVCKGRRAPGKQLPHHRVQLHGRRCLHLQLHLHRCQLLLLLLPLVPGRLPGVRITPPRLRPRRCWRRHEGWVPASVCGC
jgi:hypothetical protein